MTRPRARALSLLAAPPLDDPAGGDGHPLSTGRRTRFPFVRLVRWKLAQRSQRYGNSMSPERRAAASASCAEANRAFFLQMLSLVRILAPWSRIADPGKPGFASAAGREGPYSISAMVGRPRSGGPSRPLRALRTDPRQ